jgi:hypothetical protein
MFARRGRRKSQNAKDRRGGNETALPEWPAVTIPDELGNQRTVLPKWPVVIPSNVSTLQMVLPSSPEAWPFAMLLILDLEAVPGLTEAVDRHQRGERLDIKSAWITLLPEEDPKDSAIAVLALQLPELDLSFLVWIDVDANSEGLKIAAKTDKVIIVDEETGRHLRAQDLDKAVGGRELGFRVDDVDPLLQMLLQRVDIPLPSGATEKAEESDAEFVDGAKPASVTALLTGADAPPLVMLFDPRLEVGTFRDQLGTREFFDGYWKVRMTEEGLVARIDCGAGDERIGSWILSGAPQELGRAIVGESHGVFIVDEPAEESDGEGALLARAKKGVPLFAKAAPPMILELPDRPQSE